jgi:hypothetical protein
MSAPGVWLPRHQGIPRQKNHHQARRPFSPFPGDGSVNRHGRPGVDIGLLSQEANHQVSTGQFI